MTRKSGFHTPPLSILIVDSSHDILDADKLLLEQEGFEVYCVQGGNEALAMLLEISEPNLILLDIQIQDMSVNHFLKRLEKKFPEIIKCVPIVLLSNEEEVLQNKAVGHIKKPINIDKLLSEVHRFIEKRYLIPPIN